METHNGIRLVLKNVKNVPNIRLNLISTGKLNDERFCNTFHNSQWKLTKGSLVVARGKKNSTLYFMHVNLSKDMVNAVEKYSTIELWHKRLSHMSEKGMTVLAKKNVLSGVYYVHLEKCADFLAGK